MSRLPLSFACFEYDRTRALQDGRVRPEGIDLNFLPLRVEETFYRQLRHHEFDVSELSMSSYLLGLNDADPAFIAIPVFPSRFFRHQSIYVNSDSGIERPSDLVGKRVGMPEYQMTAAVWQRGILADHHGVPVESVRYFTGALKGGGNRDEKIPLSLPPEISVTRIESGRNLSAMLAEGELDALYGAAPPVGFESDPRMRHLFPDFKATEKEYFRNTGVFPIMHTIVVRRALFDRHPWVARSLMKAFEESLQLAYGDLRHAGALKYMLPWLEDHVEETLDALGEGYWDYGIERNRAAIETLARYSYEQGLAKRLFTVEEMFASGADDSFHV
jgi:4,5-dihydroxyphthalate decarboxylase